MKKLLLTLLLLPLLATAHTVDSVRTWDVTNWSRWFTTYTISYGYREVLSLSGTGNASYLKSGDLVFFKKASAAAVQLRAIGLYNLIGGPDSIRFRVWPGETLVINGQQVTTDSTDKSLLLIQNCTGISITGPTADGQGFKIYGSTTATRGNTFNIHVWDKCGAISVRNMWFRDGGTGAQIKREVTTNSDSWGTKMSGFHFENIFGHNTKSEGYYIGSTWIKYNPFTNSNFAPQNCNDADVSSDFKLPPRLGNVRFINVHIDSAGNDAFQFANIDTLYMRYSTAQRWGLNLEPSHRGGLFIGGGVSASTLIDCWAMNSNYGEGLHHMGTGPGHVVSNVLIYNVGGNLVFIKGGKYGDCNDPYSITFTNCTFALSQWANAVGMRNNGQFGGRGAMYVNSSIIAECGDGGFGGNPPPPRYFYVENSAPAFTEGTGGSANLKSGTLAGAGLDVNNWLMPASGTQGFRIWQTGGGEEPPPPYTPTYRNYFIIKKPG
jgi:hypothetical protein